MNLFLVFAVGVLAVIAGNGLTLYAMTMGDAGDLAAKAMDNIEKRRLKSFAKGSPAGSFWPGDLTKSGWGGVLFALMAAALTFLQNMQADVDPTSYWGVLISGAVGSLIVAVQRWLSDNPR